MDIYHNQTLYSTGGYPFWRTLSAKAVLLNKGQESEYQARLNPVTAFYTNLLPRTGPGLPKLRTMWAGRSLPQVFLYHDGANLYNYFIIIIIIEIIVNVFISIISAPA